MNKNIAIAGSSVNLAAVIGFALSMLLPGFIFGSYLFSMFIALGYVIMACSFCFYSNKDKKLAGYVSLVFSAVYAVLIFIVYFAQCTMNMDEVTSETRTLLDYGEFGLFFNYDLLGYAFMALSTFFASLTIEERSKSDKALKILLLIHGVFFISCFIMPMLGLFAPGMAGEDWIGTLVLETWCIYFIPVGLLSIKFFKTQI